MANTDTVLMQDGFGQLELNQVAFRRDGRVEAQCALDPTDFTASTAPSPVPAQNGMILVVDKVNKTLRFPKADDTNALYVLNYSTEHMYDERARGLKNFRLYTDDVYPRCGYLAKGDRYTTNTVKYDTSDYADLDAIKTAVKNGLYGVPGTEGYTVLTDDPSDSELVLQAVEFTTMPDGQPGIKFVVIKA